MTEPDHTALFQRNVAKIDRRLQKPKLAEDARRALWEFRKALFDGEYKTADDIAELDACLRTIDQRSRHWSAP